ncbi:ABC transporter permease subunit [Metabacillus herbersteinensis]|uniref:ABC transporter permease subunit n=2 Tax=Metabacillus herbersteinensis TaxID=283816 RepID=A0ABV6GFD3_9BACI
MTMLLPQKFRERIKFAIFLLESLPDILVIILLQLLIIMIYKKTDILLMKVVAVGDERAYLLPIICLALLPTIQLYRLCLHLFEEEFTKDYVLLTRAKGLKHSFILVVHILRNTVISMFLDSKKTIWYMLSALVVVGTLKANANYDSDCPLLTTSWLPANSE